MGILTRVCMGHVDIANVTHCHMCKAKAHYYEMYLSLATLYAQQR